MENLTERLERNLQDDRHNSSVRAAVKAALEQRKRARRVAAGRKLLNRDLRVLLADMTDDKLREMVDRREASNFLDLPAYPKDSPIWDAISTHYFRDIHPANAMYGRVRELREAGIRIEIEHVVWRQSGPTVTLDVGDYHTPQAPVRVNPPMVHFKVVKDG